MSSFTGFSAKEKVQYSKEASEALGRDYWLVLESFTYYIGKEGDGRTITVPAGFLTDGASVPRALWSVIPPWGPWGQAAIVHDYLVEYLSINVNGLPVRIPREYADAIFLEMLIVLGVPELTRKAMFKAVSAYTGTLHKLNPTDYTEKKKVEAALAIAVG
jgi:hypothetical protein